MLRLLEEVLIGTVVGMVFLRRGLGNEVASNQAKVMGGGGQWVVS